MILWFDLDFAIWFAFDPSVLYPSIFLAMKVTWPWHWCTNVMTPVWSSDVPHRPFVWSAFGLGRGVWMHPRFALIWFATTFGLVSGTVCNTCLSHYLGVDHSMVTMLKTLFCFVWLVVECWYNLTFILFLSFLLYLMYLPMHILLFPFLFHLLCWYICSLSFWSSAAFSFPAAGI